MSAEYDILRIFNFQNLIDKFVKKKQKSFNCQLLFSFFFLQIIYTYVFIN